jgi:FMN phosphatase YigB (HAD superfamily)
VAFVDDRQVNVEGARAVGMPARLFVDATDLRGWLVDLGVL